MLHVDHVGVIVDDLDAVAAFFLALGFEREGGGLVEGAHPLPANRLGFRHIAIQVNELDAIVDVLRGKGFDTVGEVRDFEDTYRLCYVRGPEGLIIELAERIAAEGAS